MTEVWLTGPVDGVDPLLLPAAHALLQVKHDAPQLLEGLTIEQIWRSPGGSASIGYHALHIAGSTDRLLTYARDEQLSPPQLDAAKAEKSVAGLDAGELVQRISKAVDNALDQIRQIPREAITAPRAVGRQRLPSTVLGLIFHAAEHATRHAGQISTLRKIVNS